MGRKSKAKKLIRQQMEAGEAEKELKIDKKKSKKESLILADGEVKKPRFKINKKKLFGGILALIMLAILVAVGYLIFERAFRAEPIAKFLPADSTVALVEINTNFDHTQLDKTFKLLAGHPEYSKESLIKFAETFFSLVYETDVKPWLGREVGVAYMNSAKETNVVYELYFAEVLSQTNVDKFIQRYNPIENIYTGHKTYNVKLPGGPAYVTFLDNYLVVSSKEQAIFQLVDAQNDANQKLYFTPQYRKVDNNLPLNRTAFLYVNFDQLSDNFLHKLPFLNPNGVSIAMVKPLLKAFDSEGAALIALDNDFAVQTFLTLHGNNSGASSYLSFEKKYNASLAAYLPKNTLAFWGGEDLESELQKMLSTFTGGDDSSQMLVDQILQNYTQKYFGQDTSFKNDILPLLKNEFALSIEKNNNKNVYKLIFGLETAQTDTVKIHQLASNFASYGGVFEPKVVEHTLPDGTVGREIVAAPEEILKLDSSYHDTTLYELKMGKQNWSVYYAIVNNLAVVSNDPDSIKVTIDLMKGQGESLSSTERFMNDIKPVIKGSDEVSFFDFDGILPLIFKQNTIPAALGIMSSFSSGKNYFDDGVVTINYLHIK
ncbi:MAG: DUF3352 domain-containing protein [Candidatus Peregrinibacteria bacterium]|nr:DUF3352 domain-containing protein [Candidatus Peregrinibacteria bacterium]